MGIRRHQFVYVICDAVLSMAAIFAAVWLRFEGYIPAYYLNNMGIHFLIAAATIILSGILIGSYVSIWAYISVEEILRQGFCAMFSGAVFLVIKYTHLLDGMTKTEFHISGSITIIYCIFVLMLTMGIRLVPRLKRWLVVGYVKSKSQSRTVIIGAGKTGAMIIKRLRETLGEDGIYPVVAVDSDKRKRGMRVAGIPVAGSVEDIPQIAKKYRATEAIVAIPSINQSAIPDIYENCSKANLKLRIFRDSVDVDSFLVGNRAALKDVSIEDLLFRDSIQPDMTKVYDLLEGKTVLVTGGAGSIGSEICRQVLAHGCGKLIIFDIHENGLFEIDAELKEKYDTRHYELVVGSVRDVKRLDTVFEKFSPDLVLHAAAHKHVPMMELNPIEAIKNNVVGTRNVIETCIKHHTKRFLLISTDKAVRSTNIMGATKRMAELLVQTMNGNGCEMAAVRFGNVLGSNGSVIPTFKRQIAEGGPVTVTHRDITRYFMTIPEAVSLVLTAGTIAKGGEVFILDMGRPIKIYDLACDLIRLSGLEPGKDIEVKVTGLRPGEKLYEELVQENEAVDTTSHEKIFVAKGTTPPSKEVVFGQLADIINAVEHGDNDLLLRRMVFTAIADIEKTMVQE
ncbi:MAG: polysaccharide biosynthesis protein [Clostridia bacterium]|nr:polysaccharide biosynthesis protein [Oscillospiraceae bacterium]MBQ6796744.1 polysaccharide biosynthesis protein [Clostridia bacterium]